MHGYTIFFNVQCKHMTIITHGWLYNLLLWSCVHSTGESSNTPTSETQDESITTLFSFDLQATPILSRRRITRTPSHTHTVDELTEKQDLNSGGGMLGTIDNYLSLYIRTRYSTVRALNSIASGLYRGYKFHRPMATML